MEPEKNFPLEDQGKGKKEVGFWPAFWNSRPAIFFLLLVGILIGAGIMLILKGYSGDIANLLLYVSLAFFALLLILFVVVRYLKNRFNRLVFGSEDVDYSKTIAEAQTFTNSLIAHVVDRLPQSYKGDRTIAKNLFYFLGNFLVWGRLRNWWWNWVLGLFVAIGGLAGTLLLVNQNELLQNQNELLVNQNKLVQNQMSLEEASRRGSLVVLMSNIFDKVDDEIAEQKSEMIRRGEVATDSTKYSLSQSLIGQIAALSQAFKPYRYMDGDTLIRRPLSPERGQLLVTICGLPLDTMTLWEILIKSSFKDSDLVGANLKGAYLSNADLAGANLIKADLMGANLNQSNLNSSNLNGAYLNEAYLKGAGLEEANLEGALLSGTYLNEAYLRRAHLINASFIFANLRGANLRGADLGSTNLTWTNLSEADLNGVNLSEAELVKVNLNGTNVSNVNFSNSNLIRVDLSGVQNLTMTQVISARTFYNCKFPKNIDVAKLKKEKPELFEKLKE